MRGLEGDVTVTREHRDRFYMLHWHDAAAKEARRRQRLARKLAHVLNSCDVPGVPPLTRGDILGIAVGALLIGLLLSLAILAAALPATPR